MADDEIRAERLANLVGWLRDEGRIVTADAVMDAVARLEGYAAEIDRLRISFARLAAKSSQQQAEIERLTPKPMTLEGLAKELNEYRYDDSDNWTVQDGGLACGDMCECILDPIHAIAIVKFLRRDAGPLAEKEAASG